MVYVRFVGVDRAKLVAGHAHCEQGKQQRLHAQQHQQNHVSRELCAYAHWLVLADFGAALHPEPAEHEEGEDAAQADVDTKEDKELLVSDTDLKKQGIKPSEVSKRLQCI